LDEDGLGQDWDGVNTPKSDWKGEMGDIDPDDVPTAFFCQMDPAEMRKYDTSATGTPFANDEDLSGDKDLSRDEMVDCDDGSMRFMRNLSMLYICSKLVEHFDIKWRRGEIIWPRTRGKKSAFYIDNI
jgi:hypothetical protein